MVGNDYTRAWDDCLRLVSEILQNAKSLRDARNKVGYLKTLVDQRRFVLTYQRIREELGIFEKLF